MTKSKKLFSGLKELFNKTHEKEYTTKAFYSTFGKHFEEPNDSFSMDIGSDEADGSISVNTTTINEEKDAVLIEVDGFSLDEDSSHVVILSKDNCVELIRALSTAASLLR